MSVVTGENDSVKSTHGTCIYPLTKFINFKRIIPWVSSLLLNTHFAFTLFLLIRIHDFLDRELLTSEIADMFHKFLFGLDIASMSISIYPAPVEIDLLHAYLISSSLCSAAIGMNIVSLFNFCLTSMIG